MLLNLVNGLLCHCSNYLSGQASPPQCPCYSSQYKLTIKDLMQTCKPKLAERAELWGWRRREERELVWRIVANYSVHAISQLLSSLKCRHVQECAHTHIHTHTCSHTDYNIWTHPRFSFHVSFAFSIVATVKLIDENEQSFKTVSLACKLPISSLLKTLVCIYKGVVAQLDLGTNSKKRKVMESFEACILWHFFCKMQYKCWIILEWLHGSVRMNIVRGGHDRQWRKPRLLILLCRMVPSIIYWNRMTTWLLSWLNSSLLPASLSFFSSPAL